ncbi:MAG: hypothetical protein HY904_05350 [Deltaproteobacteria bacterium]|nr:hypothetical protein [Deltaproteobacteria bacterium]
MDRHVLEVLAAVALPVMAGCATARLTVPAVPAAAPAPTVVAAPAEQGGADLVVDAWRLGGTTAAHARTRVTDIYRAAARAGTLHRHKRPTRGDAVFFHDTCDANTDGRFNDPLTLTGVVERVDADGTVVVATRIRQGVVRLRMNLEQPHLRRDPRTHKVLNHYLVGRTGGQPARTTAELWAGFASPPRGPARLAQR